MACSILTPCCYLCGMDQVVPFQFKVCMGNKNEAVTRYNLRLTAQLGKAALICLLQSSQNNVPAGII